MIIDHIDSWVKRQDPLICKIFLATWLAMFYASMGQSGSTSFATEIQLGALGALLMCLIVKSLSANFIDSQVFSLILLVAIWFVPLLLGRDLFPSVLRVAVLSSTHLFALSLAVVLRKKS